MARATTTREVGAVRAIQVSTPSLGDYTYIICRGRDAVVADPQRDIDRLEEILQQGRLVLRGVLETHVHNDYLSGGPALAARHGARYVVPSEAGYQGWHETIRDGQIVRLGGLSIRGVASPGHTPSHMSYLALDSGRPAVLFTGGSMLVGACGRTDLSGAERVETLTREQYRSLNRIGDLAENVLIAPTHGAGSFCAASPASGESWTDLLTERQQNPAFQAKDEDDFVRSQLDGLGPYPSYYGNIGSLNLSGAAHWEPAQPPILSASDVDELQRAGVSVVDVRPRDEFAAGHIPGSLNVPAGASLAPYAGWILPFGARLVLVLGRDTDTADVVREFGRIGFDRIEGVATAANDFPEGSRTHLTSYPVAGMDELHSACQATGALVIDVRHKTEWMGGHVPGAHSVHFAAVTTRLSELPKDRPIYVYCRSGYRAAIAASILSAASAQPILIAEGFPVWVARGYEVAR